MVIRWQKTFSILAPWRKGKGNKHAVLDSEVVLTKVKSLRSCQERRRASDACGPDATEAAELLRTEASDDASAIFPEPQRTGLYKFESEDSGVELPSGANSPSTPTSSEQSFALHSRKSSCDSPNLNSDSATLTDELAALARDPQQGDLADESATGDAEEDSPATSEELGSSTLTEERSDEDGGGGTTSALSRGAGEECGRLEGGDTVGEVRQFGEQRPGVERDSATDQQFEHARGGGDTQSLEEYMDQCCRLSESQHDGSNPLGSGLDYLQHICQLIEKIGKLQEANLLLQRQICSLQKSGRMTRTKEDFFTQHCSCGAATLAFQDVQKRHSRSGFVSPSGTLSDLTTIPETTQHGPGSARRERSGEALASVPLRRRGLNRRSYTDGDAVFLGDSPEGAVPQPRSGESNTWGRVRDLVRRNKSRSQSRLGLISPSLKMSCPQLYRPDLGRVEPARSQRNSMIAVGHDSRYDFCWQP